MAYSYTVGPGRSEIIDLPGLQENSKVAFHDCDFGDISNSVARGNRGRNVYVFNTNAEVQVSILSMKVKNTVLAHVSIEFRTS